MVIITSNCRPGIAPLCEIQYHKFAQSFILYFETWANLILQGTQKSVIVDTHKACSIISIVVVIRVNWMTGQRKEQRGIICSFERGSTVERESLLH